MFHCLRSFTQYLPPCHLGAKPNLEKEGLSTITQHTTGFVRSQSSSSYQTRPDQVLFPPVILPPAEARAGRQFSQAEDKPSHSYVPTPAISPNAGNLIASLWQPQGAVLLLS